METQKQPKETKDPQIKAKKLASKMETLGLRMEALSTLGLNYCNYENDVVGEMISLLDMQKKMANKIYMYSCVLQQLI